MAKRLVWKSISFTDPNDRGRMESAWASSREAFGRNKVMNFDYTDGLETNISLANLRRLASHAGVKIDWKNGIVFDSLPLAERAKDWEESETPESKAEIRAVFERMQERKRKLGF